MPEPILVNSERGPESKPPPTPYVEKSVESSPARETCAACGQHHGAVGAELACMRAALLDGRAELARMQEVVLRFTPPPKEPTLEEKT